MMRAALNGVVCAMTALIMANSWSGQRCSPGSRTEKTCVPQQYDCDKDGKCKSRDVCTTKQVKTERCYYVPDSPGSSTSSNKGAK